MIESTNKGCTYNKKWNIIFGIIYLVVFIISLFRCQYGVVSYDEGAYLAIIKRFFEGQVSMANEWHLTSLSAFVLFPLYGIAEMMQSVGIVLAWRYLSTVLWMLGVLFFYCRFQKEYPFGSLLGAVAIELYQPECITMFFYKHLSLMGVLLVVTILYTMHRMQKIQCFIAGILFAAAVLGCPSLILMWIYYVFKICVKEKEKKSFLIAFSAGAILTAVIFAMWLLRHSSIDTIIECIPYVLGDTTHQGGILKIMKRYAGAIVYMLPMVIVMVVYWLGRHKKKMLDSCMFVALILTTIVSCYYAFVDVQYSFVSAPICLIGYFLYKKDSKANGKLFWDFYMIGLWFAVLHNLVSNTGRYAIYLSMVVSMVATLLMIGQAIENNIDNKNLYIMSVGVLIVLLLWLKIYYVFPASTIIEQDNLVTDGPQKGLYIPDDYYDDYIELQDVSDELSGSDVAVLDGRYFWIYLDEDVCVHNYSAYNQMDEDNEYRFLAKYFELFGNPDYVLIDTKIRSDTFEALCESGYQVDGYYAEDVLLRYYGEENSREE